MASPSPEQWLSDEAFSPLSLPTPVEASPLAEAGEATCSQEEENWQEAADEPPPGPQDGEGQLVAVGPHAIVPLEAQAIVPLEPQAIADGPTAPIARLASVMVRRVYPDTMQPVGLESATRLTSRLGIWASLFREKVYAVGHAAWETGQRQAAAIVPRLLAACRASHCPSGDLGPRMDAVIFFRTRKYDGTRMKVTTQVTQHYDTDTVVERCTGARELFVIKSGFSIVLRKRSDDRDDFLHVLASAPTHISVLETPNAEIINACLHRQLDQVYDTLVDQRIPRQIDVIGCDGASSNLKNERLWSVQHPRRAQIVVLCRAHGKKKVAEQGYLVIRPTDTNMIRTQLSLSAEHLIAVRHNARLIHDDQVVICAGYCPAEATAHRERVFELYFGDTTDASLQFRAAVCRRLYNGDIMKTGVIEHFSNGCCQSRDHAVFLMRRYGVAALFGAVDVLNRSNWTNKMKSHRCIGLPAAVHGLLQAAYLRGVPEPPQAKRRREQTLQERAQRERLAAAGQEGVPEPLGPRPAPGCDSDGGEGADAVGAWREEQDARIVGARKWMNSSTAADDMFIASRMVSLTDAYLLKQLATSGVSFERSQQLKVSRGQERTYQAWLAHEDVDTRCLLKDVYDAIFDSSSWTPVHNRSEETALTIYLLLARMGATAYHLVFRSNRSWPMKLFYALKDPEVINELRRAEPCLFDAYTENFVNFYRGAEDSATAMAELKGAVVLIDTDTADVERLHSVNQRHARFRVWTNVETVEEMSAHFAAHSAGDWGPDSTRHGRGRAGRNPKAPRPRDRPGGGSGSLRFWTWRAFVHVNGRWLDKETAAALSEQFRQLGAEELEQYQLLAAIARDRHRDGECAFEKKPRAVAVRSVDRGVPALGLLPPQQERPGPDDVPAEGRRRQSPFADVPSPILDAAFAARRHALSLRRQRSSHDDAVAGLVSRASSAIRQDRRTASDGTFAIVDTALAQTGDADVHVDAGTILQYRRRPQLVSDETASAISADGNLSTAQRASAWESMHQTVTVASCPPCRKVPIVRRPCHDAGMCIHKGDGLELAKVVAHIKSAFARWRSADRKQSKAMLVKGEVVLRFTFTADHADPPEHLDDVELLSDGPLVAAGDQEYRFFHVAFHYARPFAPTLVELVRDPSRDDAEALGVSPMRVHGPEFFSFSLGDGQVIYA